MNLQCSYCRSGKTHIKRERQITVHNGIELFYNSYINCCEMCNNEFNSEKTIKMTSNSYKSALKRARKGTTHVH